MLTTLILVCASLVIGFSSGFLLTMHRFYLPLKRTHEKALREVSEFLEFLESQLKLLRGATSKKEKDGSMLSPYQPN